MMKVARRAASMPDPGVQMQSRARCEVHHRWCETGDSGRDDGGRALLTVNRTEAIYSACDDRRARICKAARSGQAGQVGIRGLRPPPASRRTTRRSPVPRRGGNRIEAAVTVSGDTFEAFIEPGRRVTRQRRAFLTSSSPEFGWVGGRSAPTTDRHAARPTGEPGTYPTRRPASHRARRNRSPEPSTPANRV